MKKILMLATGGTIASEMGESGLAPELTSEQLLRYIPDISGICQVECTQLFNLDSTNIGPAHWLEISAALEEKIDWTKAWGKKYPILLSYRQEVNVDYYALKLDGLIQELKRERGYSELDAFLVLKDILAAVWKSRKGQGQS